MIKMFYGKISKNPRRYLKAIGETRDFRIENWLSKFGHRPKE